MNPLVEKMLNTTMSNDVETRFLEDLFEHEMKCQSAHEDAILPGCTQEVVSVNVIRCNGKGVLYCIVAEESAKRAIENRTHTCRDCGRGIKECWTIRPI